MDLLPHQRESLAAMIRLEQESPESLTPPSDQVTFRGGSAYYQNRLIPPETLNGDWDCLRFYGVYADRAASGRRRVVRALALTDPREGGEPRPVPDPANDADGDRDRDRDIRELPTTLVVGMISFFDRFDRNPSPPPSSGIKIMRQFNSRSMAPLMRDPPKALMIDDSCFSCLARHPETRHIRFRRVVFCCSPWERFFIERFTPFGPPGRSIASAVKSRFTWFVTDDPAGLEAGCGD